jgi:hypothetical protein
MVCMGECLAGALHGATFEQAKVQRPRLPLMDDRHIYVTI